MQTLISSIDSSFVDSEITLSGWIQNIRSSGKLAFIELRDGSGYIQCVVEAKNFTPEQFEEIASLGIESSLSLTGTVTKHPKKEEYELQVSSFHVF